MTSRKKFERLMAAGGFQLRAAQRDALWRFHEMLREADQKLNLTRIRAFEAMVEKHYIDSLLPGRYTELRSTVMDLGSGGGFPGIPLAIMHPELRFKLVEGRRLRAGFLSNVVRELELGNVEVIARKLNPTDHIPARTLVTRAFASVADTFDRVAGSIDAGGRAVLLKGPNCDEEIAEAAARHPDWVLVDDVHYLLPLSQAERRLLVYERRGARPRRLEPLRSADNPRVRAWKRLTSARGIRKEQKTLLIGDRLIRELLTQQSGRIDTVVTTDPAADYGTASVVAVSKELMHQLDPISGQGPFAVVEAPPLPAWDGALDLERPTLFVATQNPDNVGAILRSADAFGVRRVVLLEEAANPYLPRALRAAGTAPWRLELSHGPTLADLGRRGLPLIGLDVKGTPIDEWGGGEVPPGIIIGLEGPGLADLSESIERVTIPIRPEADSLNAAVAAGIALWEVTRRVHG
ncbi:MAG: 16S rRNA (guanine(527)-N(7))-methyltransferase RsmG [Candidatus Dadabacteria bacterium]|nr:MAG: 16S rRNA (guanine(527)-N(7))-methyltransferase RsmG [Candidatus Dadabacteria bacterium]